MVIDLLAPGTTLAQEREIRHRERFAAEKRRKDVQQLQVGFSFILRLADNRFEIDLPGVGKERKGPTSTGRSVLCVLIVQCGNGPSIVATFDDWWPDPSHQTSPETKPLGNDVEHAGYFQHSALGEAHSSMLIFSFLQADRQRQADMKKAQLAKEAQLEEGEYEAAVRSEEVPAVWVYRHIQSSSWWVRAMYLILWLRNIFDCLFTSSDTMLPCRRESDVRPRRSTRRAWNIVVPSYSRFAKNDPHPGPRRSLTFHTIRLSKVPARKGLEHLHVDFCSFVRRVGGGDVEAAVGFLP